MSLFNPTTESRSLLENVMRHHGCTAEEAHVRIAKSVLSPFQQMMGTLLASWTQAPREEFEAIIRDLGRCRDLNEIQESQRYWRTRRTADGFTSGPYRVSTARALLIFEKYASWSEGSNDEGTSS